MSFSKHILISGISFAILSTCFTSCERNKEEEPELTVTFDIDEPASASIYAFGDTVHMHIHITGSQELHGYEIEIENTSDGDTIVYENHYHDHGDSFDVEDFWINDVTMSSEMKLHVKAIIDHADNYKEKVVTFHCDPL